ncbi:MAG: RNA polymerase sigma factor [Saprospiraceae bacterium]|nr:RNA polymerase sigma factor [Saprospiraceae bacterium]
MTDEHLMMLVADGNTGKLGILFQRHQAKLYDYFLRMTKDEFLSGDLVQLVFEKVLKGKHTYRQQYNFLGWIFRIAKNVLMDHYRTHRRTAEINDEVMGHPYAQEEDYSQSTDIEIAMGHLDEMYREVLILTRYDELKYKEVAEIIGLSETGVKTRVHRAIKQLKENYLKVINHDKGK